MGLGFAASVGKHALQRLGQVEPLVRLPQLRIGIAGDLLAGHADPARGCLGLWREVDREGNESQDRVVRRP